MERKEKGIKNFVNNKFVRLGAAAVATTVAAERVSVQAGFDPARTVDVTAHRVEQDAAKRYDQVVDILPSADEVEAQTPQIITVSPSDMHGWACQVQNSVDGSGTFVVDPANNLDIIPPGSGSVRLFTGNDGSKSTALSNGSYLNIKLSDITALTYSTYSVSTGPSTSKYPLLILDLAGGSSGPDELTFDPAVDQSQAPQLNTWQLWDALAGKWRSPLTNGTSVTISQYIAAFGPNIAITNGATGGIRMQAGPDSTQDGLDENVDNFIINTGLGDSIYDFEPGGGVTSTCPTIASTPTPTSTETPTPTSTRTATATNTPIPPTNTPTRTATPTKAALSVGGIAERIDPSTLPANSNTSEGSNGLPIGAEVAIAGGAITAGAALWINKRRKS